MSAIGDGDLEAYLDEALPAEQMARIEQRLRCDADLLARLAAINARRDAGVHGLGEIWRRHRLSCPTRQQLGSRLLGALEEGEARYVDFHLEVVECRWCQANMADLRQQQARREPEESAQRRRRYFQSSAGYLKR